MTDLDLDTSTTASPDFSDAFDDEQGVGLSSLSDQHSQQRRKLLDLIDRLRSTGVQRDIELPLIAVIGNQSAGKSSLIESISGITLPRSSGTCTRCPTECQLSYSTNPWQCDITLRFTTDADGTPLGHARNESFGPTIFDKTEVEERLRRAQRAILNPGRSVSDFLCGVEDNGDDEQREVSFSKNCICLKITGKDVADLSFVDLPGLIATVRGGGSQDDPALIKGLVEHYIKSESCLILLTVTCETDFETQGAYTLAKKHDPDGQRTIGVLTKPDRIDRGDEHHWVQFIRNLVEPLKHGWYCVKQPNTERLQAGISWSVAREDEDRFFSSMSPWKELETMYQKRLQTRNLIPPLGVTLSDLVAKRLPEIREELNKGLSNTEARLRELPDERSADPLADLYNLLSEFCADIKREVAGTSDSNGLLQSIRPHQQTFRADIRRTAPNFKPYEKENDEPGHQADSGYSDDCDNDESDDGSDAAIPDFLENEEEPSSEVQSSREEIIYISDVITRAEQAVSREFPDHTPFIVTEQYVRVFTEKWRDPAMDLCDTVGDVLHQHLMRVVDRHFAEFTHGGLKQSVSAILADQIQTALKQARERLAWQLELEEYPFTLNAHYYSDYKDKFLSHYRSQMKTSNPNGLGQLFGGRGTPLDSSTEDNIKKILSAASEIGFEGLHREDLARLLPIDHTERALRIMAEVRGYFQVAYKRFTDNVPLTIDSMLVRGVVRDLQATLFQGLGIGGDNGPEVCRSLLQELPTTVSIREELTKRRERLRSAKRELLELRM